MKLLAVCFRNTCRSPMLGVFLKFEISKRWQELKGVTVESAGLREKDNQPANEHSIACIMQMLYIDLSTHRSRYAGNLNLASYDHIYVMDEGIRDELVRLGAPADRIEVLCQADGGVPNPYQKGLATYQKCAETLRKESQRIVAAF